MRFKGVFPFIALLLDACAHVSQGPSPALVASPAVSAKASAAAHHAVLHTSSLGYTAMVSDDWMILSQDELKKNSGIFGSDNPMFAHTDKNILFAMKQKIENGELEVFMSTSPADLLFVSNVNVAKQIGRIPTDINSANQLCSQLPALYTKEFGKPVQFDRCGLETIGGRQVIHIVGPGMLPDTTTVQYFMQQSQNEMLLFTGTFKTQSSEDERKEFDSIVDSVKF